RRRSPATEKARPIGKRRDYANKVSLKREFETCEVDLSSASDAMKKVFAELKATRRLDVRSVQTAISPLVDSVLRNSEAMAALVRMKSKGEYLYNHSLANAVWAAVLGRHLGLERATLLRLALGAALLDVGMASIADEITYAPEILSEEAMARVREHVRGGLDLLRASDDLHPDVLEIVASHHERHDGSGYPAGLTGLDIPLLGRLAGLVDSYDAMITARPHAQARSSFEAMQELADLKDSLFQGELVEQLMQAIGLFPTGAVVELNSGEVGVVVQQNASRRLRPKVVVVLDAQKKRHRKLIVLDLAKYVSENENQSDLWISRELEPGAHGLHPDEYFL
ncbi:MAG: HD domain-containing protein, partial [Gammaproteobacteria bacterium]|nr:HD domain-containing protein [Gammaproteobacteria bacterium]